MSNTQYDGTTGTRKSGPDAAKSETDALRQDAEKTVRDVSDTVVGEAHARADAAKEGVADEISSVSRALRKASEELRDGSPQERTFGAAASSMADFADTVRDKDLGQMVDEMGDFARRNPMAFLGGAALLGFAGVRMAKASRRARTGDDHHDDRHGGAQPYYGRGSQGGQSGQGAYGATSAPGTPQVSPTTGTAGTAGGVSPTRATGATTASASPTTARSGKGETS
ncbi:hypothetical protein [Marinovum sp.]|uniref:hypothetical protein n=1 Tax=Marinovum sp. TaxID=2024839 RepID=UPI002B266F32|nr:hypothetical protein [Marinovum sp.]